eukprot:6214694-Pleurochrysis_carterae.AAC.1
MLQGTKPMTLKGDLTLRSERPSSRRCMDAAAPDSGSPPPSASAKRSLRTAIDGTPDRPDPGRVLGNNDND